MRREIAGVVPGAQPTALIGHEQRVELARDMPLRHLPPPGEAVEGVPPLVAKAAELVRYRGDKEPAPHAVGQVDGGGLTHPEQLVDALLPGNLAVGAAGGVAGTRLC